VFSRSVDFRGTIAENPIVRIAMGIAVSIPWPSFNATYAAAAEKMTVITIPRAIARGVTSAIGDSGETTGL